MGHLGEVLREARRRKGITLAQAEKETRIREKYLAALEEEDYESLPGNVYAKGYLRNYAQYLSLDPDKVLQLYPNYPTGPGRLRPDEPVLPPATKPLEAPHRPLPSFAVILFFVILAGAIFAWVYSALLGPSSIVPTPTIPIPTPTEVVLIPTAAPDAPTDVPQAAPTPRTYDGLEIQATFRSAGWVLVEEDGKQVFAGTLPAGTVRTWKGQNEVSIWSGNSTQIDITANGVDKGPLGDKDVVQKIFTLK